MGTGFTRVVGLTTVAILLGSCTGTPSDGVSPSPTTDPGQPSRTPSAAAESELLVACDKNGTTAVDGPVMARSEGVHISYDGPFPMVLIADRERHRVGDWAPLVLSLAPGRHTIQCSPLGVQVARDPQSFEVLDTSGYWFDPSLDCSTTDNADFDSSGVKVEGDATDELEASARSFFGSNIIRPPLKPGYTVRPGAYPEQSRERVVLAVDAESHVIGALRFMGRGNRWWPSSIETCDFSAIF
jgi:hypothetical protein